MADEKPKKKGAGAGCLIPFGGIFFLAGMGVLIFGLIIPTFEGWGSKNWPTAQGELVSNTVQSHSDSDGTTYSLDLLVEFPWQGQTIQTERLNVYPINSSGRDYYESRKKSFDQQVARRGTVTVWVKESDPSRSILDPGLSLSSSLFLGIFGTIFAGIGFGIMTVPFFVKPKEDKPDGNWTPGLKGSVRSGFPVAFWVYGFMGLMFCGLGALVVVKSFEEIEKGNYLILIAYLFPLTGLWMLWLSLKTLLEYNKFGSLEITFDPEAPRLGSDMVGSCIVPVVFDPGHVYKVSFGHYKRSTASKQRNSSSNDSYGTCMWNEEGYATTSGTTRGTQIKFAFPVPEKYRPTGDLDDIEYKWRLFIEADLPGLDLNREIEIPVAEAIEDAPEPRMPFTYSRDEARIEKTVELPGKIVRIDTETDGSPRFHFPASRNRGMGIFMTIFSSIFMGAGIGVGYFIGIKGLKEMEEFDLFESIFAVVPGFMGIIFFLIGFGLFLFALHLLFNSITLLIDRNGTLIVTNRYLLFSSSKTYILRTLSNLRRNSNTTSTGSKGKVTVYYELLCDTEGKKLKLGDGLKGTQICDAVEERLREALNKAGATL